ncbi:hypothetical protein DV515_00017392, partial [Chloebia gouldiae]
MRFPMAPTSLQGIRVRTGGIELEPNEGIAGGLETPSERGNVWKFLLFPGNLLLGQSDSQDLGTPRRPGIFVSVSGQGSGNVQPGEEKDPGRAQNLSSAWRGSRRAGEGIWDEGWRDRTLGMASHCQRAGMDGIWEGILAGRVVRGWDGIPRESVAAPSLELSNASLDRAWSNLGIPPDNEISSPSNTSGLSSWLWTFSMLGERPKRLRLTDKRLFLDGLWWETFLANSLGRVARVARNPSPRQTGRASPGGSGNVSSVPKQLLPSFIPGGSRCASFKCLGDDFPNFPAAPRAWLIPALSPGLAAWVRGPCSAFSFRDELPNFFQGGISGIKGFGHTWTCWFEQLLQESKLGLTTGSAPRTLGNRVKSAKFPLDPCVPSALFSPGSSVARPDLLTESLAGMIKPSSCFRLRKAGIQREAGSGGGFGHLLERVWELGFGSFFGLLVQGTFGNGSLGYAGIFGFPLWNSSGYAMILIPYSLVLQPDYPTAVSPTSNRKSQSFESAPDPSCLRSASLPHAPGSSSSLGFPTCQPSNHSLLWRRLLFLLSFLFVSDRLGSVGANPGDAPRVGQKLGMSSLEKRRLQGDHRAFSKGIWSRNGGIGHREWLPTGRGQGRMGYWEGISGCEGGEALGWNSRRICGHLIPRSVQGQEGPLSHGIRFWESGKDFHAHGRGWAWMILKSVLLTPRFFSYLWNTGLLNQDFPGYPKLFTGLEGLRNLLRSLVGFAGKFAPSCLYFSRFPSAPFLLACFFHTFRVLLHGSGRNSFIPARRDSEFCRKAAEAQKYPFWLLFTELLGSRGASGMCKLHPQVFHGVAPHFSVPGALSFSLGINLRVSSSSHHFWSFPVGIATHRSCPQAPHPQGCEIPPGDGDSTSAVSSHPHSLGADPNPQLAPTSRQRLPNCFFPSCPSSASLMLGYANLFASPLCCRYLAASFRCWIVDPAPLYPARGWRENWGCGIWKKNVGKREVVARIIPKTGPGCVKLGGNDKIFHWFRQNSLGITWEFRGWFEALSLLDEDPSNSRVIQLLVSKFYRGYGAFPSDGDRNAIRAVPPMGWLGIQNQQRGVGGGILTWQGTKSSVGWCGVDSSLKWEELNPEFLHGRRPAVPWIAPFLESVGKGWVGRMGMIVLEGEEGKGLVWKVGNDLVWKVRKGFVWQVRNGLVWQVRNYLVWKKVRNDLMWKVRNVLVWKEQSHEEGEESSSVEGEEQSHEEGGVGFCVKGEEQSHVEGDE